MHVCMCVCIAAGARVCVCVHMPVAPLTPLVLLELRLVREGDAVDTLQGLLGHISTPEGTAAVGHTDSLQHQAQHQPLVRQTAMYCHTTAAVCRVDTTSLRSHHTRLHSDCPGGPCGLVCTSDGPMCFPCVRRYTCMHYMQLADAPASLHGCMPVYAIPICATLTNVQPSTLTLSSPVEGR